jgi:hypothetical protein
LFRWPFSTRGATKKARDKAKLSKPRPISFDEFSSNDTYIKVALPELVDSVIDTLSARHESSRQDVVRATLFRHLYGSLAYDDFLAWKRETALYKQAESNSGPMLSPQRGISMHDIGKSTSNIKYWIPARMKEDLQAVAGASGDTLSVYVRLLLIRDFLGEAEYQSLSENKLKPSSAALADELEEG